MASRLAIGNGDAEQALVMADEACCLGRSLPDRDVECLGLTYRGHALMSKGLLGQGLGHRLPPRSPETRLQHPYELPHCNRDRTG